MRMTTKQLAELYARRAGYKPKQMEKDIQQDIVDYCKERRWPVLRHCMAHKIWGTIGWPDLTILLPGAKVMLVECKRKGQKLRPEQLGLKTWSKELGHEIHIVTCLDEFMSVLCKYIC